MTNGQTGSGGGGNGGIYAILILIVILILAAVLYVSNAFGPDSEPTLEDDVQIEAPVGADER